MGEVLKTRVREQQEDVIDVDIPVVEKQIDDAEVDDMLDEIDAVLADQPKIDELLKEIDGILETNPAQFIAKFQQIGGE